MTEQEWIKQLELEGYTGVFVQHFESNTAFGSHTHEQAAVHVILEGDMVLEDANGSKSLVAGDRFEIPKGTIHTAKCGEAGCTFIVGTKRD